MQYGVRGTASLRSRCASTFASAGHNVLKSPTELERRALPPPCLHGPGIKFAHFTEGGAAVSKDCAQQSHNCGASSLGTCGSAVRSRTQGKDGTDPVDFHREDGMYGNRVRSALDTTTGPGYYRPVGQLSWR
jgi:hypothetical protein